jgi:hypothetical protein
VFPTEQDAFYELVAEALGLYAKTPTPADLELWWRACRGLSLADVDRALKAHADHPEDGKRAPRPVDVTRRVKAGARTGSQCSARDATGQCEYPGIFSDGTGGEGPWWCPWHRVEHSGPEASRWIEVSRDVPSAEAMAKRAARMHAESIRSPAVVATAHVIAKRHGNRPWQARERWAMPSEQQEAAE